MKNSLLQQADRIKSKQTPERLQAKASPSSQSRKICSPNNKYEREANSMADQIIHVPQTFSSQPLSKGVKNIQRKCGGCVQEDDTIQRKPLKMKSEGGSPVAMQALSAQLNSTKGNGSPLPSGTNNFMSNAFSTDFSSVRVHTGKSAIQMNQGLNARAFTHGSDVYFNKGQYSPESSEGKRLLGHELTHVVQQESRSKLSLKSHIQRTCHPESHYISASNYCRDDTFSPSTHPGKTCYRQIPVRSSYFSCPAGEHVCFDGSGLCEDSPDRSSLAESKEPGGECNWNGYCVAEHTAVDFVPAVADDMAEPFREIGREAMKAFDWRTWIPLARGY